MTITQKPPLTAIINELTYAKNKHPLFPDDPIHAAAILGEESGELTQAVNDFVYSDGSVERLKKEAAQCGAMAIRFLENIARYEAWKAKKEEIMNDKENKITKAAKALTAFCHNIIPGFNCPHFNKGLCPIRGIVDPQCGDMDPWMWEEWLEEEHAND